MIQAPRRFIRHIQPIGPRVLVRLLHGDNVHESGLYLPEGSKEKHAEALYCEVVEVARAHSDEDVVEDLGKNVSGVPCGAYVLVPKDRGTLVPWDDDLRIVEVKHILATVEEVPLEAAH